MSFQSRFDNSKDLIRNDRGEVNSDSEEFEYQRAARRPKRQKSRKARFLTNQIGMNPNPFYYNMGFVVQPNFEQPYDQIAVSPATQETQGEPTRVEPYNGLVRSELRNCSGFPTLATTDNSAPPGMFDILKRNS